MILLMLVRKVYILYNIVNFAIAGRLVGRTDNLIPSLYNLPCITSVNNNIDIRAAIEHKKNIIFNNGDSHPNIYISHNDFVREKRVITVSPGMYKGFYMLGVNHFIKKNYNLDNYIFSGASAGAWNCLFLSFNKSPEIFVNYLLNIDFSRSKSINEIQYMLKYGILDKFSESDFDMNRLFISTTSLHKMELQTNIFSDFDNLSDVIDCCIASSNTPFYSGNVYNKYHDMVAFDGGFSKSPYLNLTTSALHVSPNMWNNYIHKKEIDIFNIQDILVSKKINIFSLFEKGIKDSEKYKYILDDKLIY